jgi:hypothetical protein
MRFDVAAVQDSPRARASMTAAGYLGRHRHVLIVLVVAIAAPSSGPTYFRSTKWPAPGAKSSPVVACRFQSVDGGGSTS